MNATSSSADDGPDVDDVNVLDETVLQLLDNPFDANISLSTNLRTDPKFNGFDTSMGKTWIYPTNYPVRQYQMNICRAALFKNTLVVLPTGLGKTFIASVVMYNLFRWYPKGKIIFMAPTRPLVAQQIDACYQIMGFPKDETIELTGKQNKKLRSIAWQTKRVFYATPQVVWSDLNDAEMHFPINDIKLIVVDEAHKAKGKYAYVEVVQSIHSRNKMFRVLALSATPGKSLKDVADVVQNLFISHIEVRRESSIDVVQYIHKKTTTPIIVPMDERLKRIRRQFFVIIGPYIEMLFKYGVINANAESLSKQWLLHSFTEFKSAAGRNRHPEYSDITFNFSVCISMYHALELLEGHGLRVFLNYFNDGSAGNSADEKFFVAMDPNIRKFIEDVRMETQFVPFADNDMSFYGGDVPPDDAENIDYGHPKFELLRECLVKHFQVSSDTKAIVFCEFRESVYLINRMLLSERPLIKPKVFVGQGSKHSRTITQKEQMAIMASFRTGKINTLIATCVAEEGIDVGEVDYIVCFDMSNKNPIRFVQRSGRTGRKRQGKITILATEGKEEQKMRGVLANKDGINPKISKSAEVTAVLFKDAPRLIPPEFNPSCVETFIEIKNDVPMDTSITKTKKPTKAKQKSKAKPTKKESIRSRDVRNFFQPVDLDDGDNDDFDLGETSNLSTSLNRTDGNSNISMEQCELVNSCLRDLIDERIEKDNTKCVEYIPLHSKVESIFRRYCDIMCRSLRVSSDLATKPSSVHIDQLPEALKQFYTRKKSNQSKLFRNTIDNWSAATEETQLKYCQLMAMLNNKKRQKPTIYSSAIEFGIIDVIEEPKKRQPTISEVPLNSQLSSSLHVNNPDNLPSQLEPEPEPEPVVTVNRPSIISSTPNKMTIGSPMLPIHSPISNCTFSKPLESTRKQHFMDFLGLRTIDDLFTSFTEPPNQSKSLENSRASRQLHFNNADNDESVANSQSTAFSRICNDENRDLSAEKRNTSNEPIKLNIGNIDNLFSDASNDGSDCTVDYDISETMSKQPIPTQMLPSQTYTSDVGSDAGAAAKSVTRIKSDDLFSTYNESNAIVDITANSTKSVTILPSKRGVIERRQRTPEPPSTKPNLSIYHYRSPSMLTKSSSVFSKSVAREPLNANLNASSLNDTLHRTCSSTSEKNASILVEKLSVLNSQLSVSRHFDDSDESKENFETSFATCQTGGAATATATATDATKPSTNQYDIDTDFEDDDIFATCQPVLAKSDYHFAPPHILKTPEAPKTTRAKRKTNSRRRNMFIDDEADVSDDDSEDDDDSFLISQTHFTQTVDEGDPSVDMRAKYLQSIRSPVNQRNFRIPRIGYRNVQATQNIFSQFVEADDSKYEEDSFVVGSDEEEVDDEDDDDCESNCSDFNEITIAAIQKTRKRKSDENGNCGKKKRRRIIAMSSDSD